MSEIPFGFCHCGCGRKTNIAKCHDKRYGAIKGQPRKFLKGHSGRREPGPVSCLWGGYITSFQPSHPRASKHTGYVRTHILEAEKLYGGPLPEGAIVHHMSDKFDNSKLHIFANRSEHAIHHANERAKTECGHETWRKCKHCHKYDDPLTMSRAGRSYYHPECRRKYRRAYRASKGAKK